MRIEPIEHYVSECSKKEAIDRKNQLAEQKEQKKRQKLSQKEEKKQQFISSKN
jgi:hypothetical protein